MTRISVFLTNEQLEVLRRYASQHGIMFGELLRRIVDDWRERQPTPVSPKK